MSSGTDIGKQLARLGYRLVRVTGSHARYERDDGAPVTVPLHKELKRGTLASIVRTVAEQTGLPKAEVRRILLD